MKNPLTIHIILFVVMAVIYGFFPGGFENNFTRLDGSKKPPTFVDIMYFTSTVHSTTGFGDIIASSQLARLTTTIHMLLVFSFLILGIEL